MQVKTIDITYSMSDRFRIYTIGDEHLGTKHCVENDLMDKVKEIESNPLNRWIGMGDKGEFITPSDPRWEYEVLSDWLYQDNIARGIEKRYCEIYNPIADKCDGLLGGNHEESIRRHNSDNVHKNICDELKVDDLGFACFIVYNFHRKNSNETHRVKGLVTHGSGNATTPQVKLGNLIRLMRNFEADFYAMGHVHDILSAEIPVLGLNDKNLIKHKVKVGTTTGCWFRTYTQGIRASYGEQKLYAPTTIGCPYFEINPNTGEVTVGK